MISEYLIALVVLAAIFLIGSRFKNRKPTTVPGPSLLQGLWDFLQSMKQDSLHLTAAKWADQYGDIVSLNTLFRQVIFVNSAALTRKLVCDPSTREFSNDRPPTFMGTVFFYGAQDILLGRYGKDLLKRRKIFHHLLKFYGEGVHNFEALMKTTSKDLCQRLTKYEGDVSLSEELAHYIRWVVGLLLKGPETCEEDLDALIGFIDRATECFIFEKEIVLETVPFAPHIPGLGLRKLVGDLKVAQEVMKQRFFLAIRETYHKGERTGIVTDMLDQQAELKEKGNASEMPDDLILGLIQDIASAAYATTVGTLNSLFLQLLVDQKLQDRIHAEICEVIGDESPSFEQRRHMPFTEATILETLRYSSTAPQLLPHYACGDIHFEGHFIPKGTFLILNAWYFHHREDLWEDPWEFKPERFLDSDGQLLDPEHPTRQNLLPFGTGKRSCPGESFSRIRIFFIVVTLLQKYRFLPPVDVPLPSTNPKDWKTKTVICPDEFKCRMEPRLTAKA